MKVDVNNKNNRFTQRTLATFSQALFQLLEKKSFEEITVNELCGISNYPRSTFYNYFEDIYDLLEYGWTTVSADIVNEEYLESEDAKHTQFLFHKMYEFMELNENSIMKIMKYNTLDGKMIESLRRYMRSVTRRIMEECDIVGKSIIPYSIMVEHYSNTIELMLKWCFLKDNKVSEKEAYQYIDYLLVRLER